MFGEQDLISWLASDNGVIVHSTIFGLLILGGLGFPIPEDIPILLGGVAVAKKIVPANITFLVCFCGVMIGDQTMFFIGHQFGQKLLSAGTKSRFFPSITEAKVHEVREGLRKRRLLYIFIARHLFPIRSVTFVTAGALRIPFFEFLIADAIAAFVSVSIVMVLGHWLGDSLTPENVRYISHKANYYIVIGVLLVVGAYCAQRYIRSRKNKAERLGSSE